MSGTRQEVRDYLACSTHGNEKAHQVCGECGQPLCSDCASTVPDLTLTDYDTDGARTIAIALTLIVGVPVVVGVLPKQFWLLFVDLAGQPLFIQPGLRTGAIVVGIAMLGTVYFRGGSSASDLRLLTRNSNERVVCSDCQGDKQFQRTLLYAVTGVAVLVMLFGLWQSVQSLDFSNLNVVGVGLAVFVARDGIATGLLALLE